MIIKDEMKKAEDNQKLAVKKINDNGYKYMIQERYNSKFRMLNFIPIAMLGLVSIPFIAGASTSVLVLSTAAIILGGGNYYFFRYNKLRKEIKDKYNTDDINTIYTKEIEQYKEGIKEYGIENRKAQRLYEMDKNGIVAANIQKDDNYDAIMDMYYDYIDHDNCMLKNKDNIKVRKLKK